MSIDFTKDPELHTDMRYCRIVKRKDYCYLQCKKCKKNIFKYVNKCKISMNDHKDDCMFKNVHIVEYNPKKIKKTKPANPFLPMNYNDSPSPKEQNVEKILSSLPHVDPPNSQTEKRNIQVWEKSSTFPPQSNIKNQPLNKDLPPEIGTQSSLSQEPIENAHSPNSTTGETVILPLTIVMKRTAQNTTHQSVPASKTEVQKPLSTIQSTDNDATMSNINDTSIIDINNDAKYEVIIKHEIKEEKTNEIKKEKGLFTVKKENPDTKVNQENDILTLKKSSLALKEKLRSLEQKCKEIQNRAEFNSKKVIKLEEKIRKIKEIVNSDD